MDEFGVLVESIGFRANGKSAPMAKSKPNPKSHFSSPKTTSSFADSSSLPVDELDGIFRSSGNGNGTRGSRNLMGHDDDIFGVSSNQFGGVDLESVLSVGNKNDRKNGSNSNSGGSNGFDDLLGFNSKQSGGFVDDVFGSFEVHSGGKPEKKASSGFEELIPGFGGTSPLSEGRNSTKDKSPMSSGRQSRSRSTVEDDPFSVFESSVSKSDASWPFDGQSKDKGKGSVQVSLDELDDFVMGGGHKDSRPAGTKNKYNNPSSGEDSNVFENVDDLFFSGRVQKNHAASTTTTTQDFEFDFFHGENGSKSKQTSPWSSSSTKKGSPVASKGDDFTSLFGDIGISSGEFHEIEGEPEERRRVRLNRHMRVTARMAEALAEKNQRDFESQQEQDEKRRLAETLDNDIKRWAAGKEGNLRALLSSLQQILWAGSGWRPVSLTDMITSDSVKKVYKKATLYVHPDKVQQKGANLEQKYIAEKVFDLLKESWNKFSQEELR